MNQDPITNAKIADALREMALFLEMQEIPFKPRAFEKAAQVVGATERPLAEFYAEGGLSALDALPAVGKGIAKRIAGMLETGTLDELEQLREQTPIDIVALTAVSGIGPRRALTLYEALEVRNVEDLERAAEQGRIRTLPGFGERSETKIREAVRLYQETVGRRPIAAVIEDAIQIEAILRRVPGVERATVAGSLRRQRETIGDIDVLVAAEPTAGARASAAFEVMPSVVTVEVRGPRKTQVRLDNGLTADLQVVTPESFGAALLYFTGSKAHNVALRRLAISKGYKLNEYGLFQDHESLAGRSEQGVYAALGLDWIAPELREDTGEIEAALAGELPTLIQAQDIRGDLHVHSNWTDGSFSIAAMAEAARAFGLEYIAITDHTGSLAMNGHGAGAEAHGLDEDRLHAQIAEIRRVNHELEGIRVLTGIEVNILADGSLDVSDELLAELEVVGVAVHSQLDLPRDKMTRRLIRAIEHPHVDMLMHPMGRMLGRRPPINCDFEAVLAACVQTGTILEINAQPHRLDLPDTMVRRAIEVGAKLAINSDAHTMDEFGLVARFGLGVARRGWAEPRHVVNSQSCDELLATLGPVHARAAS